MFLTKVIETNEEAEKTFSNLQEQKILCLFKQNQIQKTGFLYLIHHLMTTSLSHQ